MNYNNFSEELSKIIVIILTLSFVIMMLYGMNLLIQDENQLFYLIIFKKLSG